MYISFDYASKCKLHQATGRECLKTHKVKLKTMDELLWHPLMGVNVSFVFVHQGICVTIFPCRLFRMKYLETFKSVWHGTLPKITQLLVMWLHTSNQNSQPEGWLCGNVMSLYIMYTPKRLEAQARSFLLVFPDFWLKYIHIIIV